MTPHTIDRESDVVTCITKFKIRSSIGESSIHGEIR